MELFCDLHTHSIYSDGTFTPAQLIRQAEKIGLRAVALCDHNTVDGLPEFLRAAEKSPVEAIAGVEFSTDYRDGELHILALFLRPEHFAAVEEKVKALMQRKEQSNVDLIVALNRAGLSLDYAAIKAGTPNAKVNRAVIGAEMVRLGYCSSVQEAFQKWLSPSHGYFHPPERLDAFEVIRFIRSIGAVSVLAHPFLNLDEAQLREFLEKAVPCGLDAVEAYYPKFTLEQSSAARRIACEFGILMSGGSDFHGGNKPDIQLGWGRGELRVSLSLMEELRKQSKYEKTV